MPPLRSSCGRDVFLRPETLLEEDSNVDRYQEGSNEDRYQDQHPRTAMLTPQASQQMPLQAYPQATNPGSGLFLQASLPFFLSCQIIWNKIRTHTSHAGPERPLSAAIPGVGLCQVSVCPGGTRRHTLPKKRYDQRAAPGTGTRHSWMGFCFQTSLLQPATHILQAILMFLESPPKNNHIIQISRTCGLLNGCQNQIHAPLRGARGIAETKRRHVKLGE